VLRGDIRGAEKKSGTKRRRTISRKLQRETDIVRRKASSPRESDPEQLRNVHCEDSKGVLTVVTGVAGSGRAR